MRRSLFTNMPDSDDTISEEEVRKRSLEQVVSRKVRIGSASAPEERRADLMADAIMRTPARLTRDYDERPSLHRQTLRPLPLANSTGDSGASHSQSKGDETMEEVATRALFSKGSGRPLSDASLAFFEPRFGFDLGAVRMHDGPDARRVASRLNARAFAYGHDIWLGPGESERNRRLLAHELAHVVQGDATPGGTSAIRRYVRTNTIYLWDLYESSGRDAASITDNQLRTTIEYEDYRRNDLVWRFSDSVALGALRRSLDLFVGGVRGRRPNYIRAGREARAAAHGLETISVEELGFTGDHMIASTPGGPGAAAGANIDDPDGSSPVYTSARVSHPVAYNVGAVPTMFARFLVSPSISPDVPDVQVRALAGNTIVGQASGLTITGSAIEDTGTGTGIVTGITGGSPLPGRSAVGWAPEHIDFQVSTDGGQIWFNAGTVSVDFIFTASTPAPPGGTLREDALDLASIAARIGGSPEVGLRGLVQSSVRYDPSVGMPSSFANSDEVMKALVVPHQCDSQAYLLRYFAMSLGIPAEVTYFWMGTTSRMYAYIVPSSGWHGPSFQCDRPAEDLATARPHFTFHALTRINGVLHDASYDRTGLPGILEWAPGAGRILAPRSTFVARTTDQRNVACSH